MGDKANNMIIRRGTKRCSTRLQKHAPASLEIDKVLSGRPANPFVPSSEASKALPFLTPLIISPQTLHAEITIQGGTSENSGCGSIGNIEGHRTSSSTPTTGQHPAMASFPRPSSLCGF